MEGRVSAFSAQLTSLPSLKEHALDRECLEVTVAERIKYLKGTGWNRLPSRE